MSFVIERMQSDADLEAMLRGRAGFVQQPDDARVVRERAAASGSLLRLRDSHAGLPGRGLLRVLEGRGPDSHQQSRDSPRTSRQRGLGRDCFWRGCSMKPPAWVRPARRSKCGDRMLRRGDYTRARVSPRRRADQLLHQADRGRADSARGADEELCTQNVKLETPRPGC